MAARFSKVKIVVGGETVGGIFVPFLVSPTGEISVSGSDPALGDKVEALGDIHPFATGGQALNIAAASVRSTALTVGKRYTIIAEEDCYIAAGDVTVDATTASYFLQADIPINYSPVTDYDYIAVIRSIGDAPSGLHICRASL